VVKPTPAKKKVILDAIVPRRNNRCHYLLYYLTPPKTIHFVLWWPLHYTQGRFAAENISEENFFLNNW